MRIKNIGSNMTEVHLNNGDVVLISYETPVAALTAAGAFKTEKKWSATTTRHINKWGPEYKGGTKPQEFFDNLI